MTTMRVKKTSLAVGSVALVVGALGINEKFRWKGAVECETHLVVAQKQAQMRKIAKFAAAGIRGSSGTGNVPILEAGDLRFCPDEDGKEGGIDRAEALFVASHGERREFNLMPSKACSAPLLLGDQCLKYVWSCSCRTLAHGPTSCQDELNPDLGQDYVRPQCFSCQASECLECGGHTPSSPFQEDSCESANVFLGMGPSIAPKLRMLCAGSSNICSGDGGAAAGVWERLGKGTLSAAYLGGLGAPGLVPLCITRGAAGVYQSPLLWDRDFKDYDNEWGLFGYLHIAYPVWFTSTNSELDRLWNTARTRLEAGDVAIPGFQLVGERAFLGKSLVKDELEPAFAVSLPRARKRFPGIKASVEAALIKLGEPGSGVDSLDFGSDQTRDRGLAALAEAVSESGSSTQGRQQPQEPFAVRGIGEIRVDIARDPALGPDQSPTTGVRSYTYAGLGEVTRLVELDAKAGNPFRRLPVIDGSGRVSIVVDPQGPSGNIVSSTGRWPMIGQPTGDCQICRPSCAAKLALRDLLTEDQGCSYSEERSRFEFGYRQQHDILRPSFRFVFGTDSPDSVARCPPRELLLDACDARCQDFSQFC